MKSEGLGRVRRVSIMCPSLSRSRSEHITIPTMIGTGLKKWIPTTREGLGSSFARDPSGKVAAAILVTLSEMSEIPDH
jgi:hypothetical protein